MLADCNAVLNSKVFTVWNANRYRDYSIWVGSMKRLLHISKRWASRQDRQSQVLHLPFTEQHNCFGKFCPNVYQKQLRQVPDGAHGEPTRSPSATCSKALNLVHVLARLNGIMASTALPSEKQLLPPAWVTLLSHHYQNHHTSSLDRVNRNNNACTDHRMGAHIGSLSLPR